MKYTFSLFIISLFILSGQANAQLPATWWKINTVVGNGNPGFGGDGLFAMNATLNGPLAVGMDSSSNLYILDYYNRRIRRMNALTGTISTIAGSGLSGNTGDNNIATSAGMQPRAMAVDLAGNVFIADEAFSVIRKIDPTGMITRYAGTTAYGYTGDGGQALNATFMTIYGLAVDNKGNLFVADAGAHVIRKINAAGVISTVAGKDSAGYSGDNGPATMAKLDSPYAVTVDRIGNLYISDHRNNVVRKVDTTSSHIITTVAGTYGVHSHTGDGGLAVLATINGPAGLHVDTLGNLFICDADNQVIRKVDTAKKISTFVGLGGEGFAGDLGSPQSALLDNPFDILIDKKGSYYIADANNQRIRKVYDAIYLGVNNVAGTNIMVYPNPASDYITVSGLAKGDRVFIYDVMGRLLSSYTIDAGDSRPFLVRNLIPGQYFFQVADASGNNKGNFKVRKD